jgi:putative ABC transport system permease protein
MVGTYLDAKRMMAGLSIGAAGLALALAVLGVYGVTAFVIRQRSEEIGIRIAIGASRGDIFRLLVGQGLRPVLIGLTIGLAGALAGIHWLANILTLAGIGPRDPVAVGTAVTVLLTSAVAAVLAPARRAARTDPANILRAQ